MKKLMRILSGFYLISLPVLAWSLDFFVDPSAPLNGDGTSPQTASETGGPGAYNSWLAVKFQDNGRYFQRCGTTANITQMIDIKKSNLTIGAYELSDGNTIINSCADLPKVRGPGHSLSIAIRIRNAKDVVIEHLDIGETRTALTIQAGSRFIIRESRIGAGSALGIAISGALIVDDYRLSADGEISANEINSRYADYHPVDQYQPDLLADGIFLQCGVEAVQVIDNTILDWGHNGVNISCEKENELAAQRNLVKNNRISAENSPYCRGFAVGGIEGKAQFNTFEDNTVERTNVRNQINGNNNVVRGNVIDMVLNSPFKSYPTGQGIHLQAFGSQVCHDNIIENNTIRKTSDAAIYFNSGNNVKENNIIRGNVIVDAGLAGIQDDAGTVIYVPDSENIGNNIFSDNLIRLTGEQSEEPAVIYFRGKQLTVTQFNAEQGTGTEDAIFNNTFLWGEEKLSAPKNLTIN